MSTPRARSILPAWPYATLGVLIALGHALDIVSTWLAFMAGAHEINPVGAFIMREWGGGGIMLAKTLAVLLLEALLVYVIRTPALRRRGGYATFGLASCVGGALLVWSVVALNLVNAVIGH